MSPTITWKVSFALAAVDLVLATICAAAGDGLFIPYMVLAGLMYGHGLYFKSKAEETGE